MQEEAFQSCTYRYPINTSCHSGVFYVMHTGNYHPFTKFLVSFVLVFTSLANRGKVLIPCMYFFSSLVVNPLERLDLTMHKTLPEEYD